MNPSNPNDPHNNYESCTDAQGRTDAPTGECPSCGGVADDGIDVDGSPHRCLECQEVERIAEPLETCFDCNGSGGELYSGCPWPVVCGTCKGKGVVVIPPLVGGGQGCPDYDPEPCEFQAWGVLFAGFIGGLIGLVFVYFVYMGVELWRGGAS